MGTCISFWSNVSQSKVPSHRILSCNKKSWSPDTGHNVVKLGGIMLREPDTEGLILQDPVCMTCVEQENPRGVSQWLPRLGPLIMNPNTRFLIQILMKMSKLDFAGYTTVNMLKANELCTLNGWLCCLLSTSIYVAPLKIMVIINTFYQTYKRADADPLLWEASICSLQTPRLWLPASNSLQFKSWPLLTAHCKSLQALLFPCRQCDVISLFSASWSLPPHLLWHSPLLFRINYLFTGPIYSLLAFLRKVALSLLHLCNPHK